MLFFSVLSPLGSHHALVELLHEQNLFPALSFIVAKSIMAHLIPTGSVSDPQTTTYRALRQIPAAVRWMEHLEICTPLSASKQALAKPTKLSEGTFGKPGLVSPGNVLALHLICQTFNGEM